MEHLILMVHLATKIIVTKEAIIQKTIQALHLLPVEKVEEISEFADFLLSKYDNIVILEGIQSLQSESSSFSFLHDDEELYSSADIKEKY